MNDITTKQDVENLVNTFYEKVLQDVELAPFFTRLDFKAHMPKMVHFWSFVLLDEPGYTTNVTDKHMHMHLSKAHFDRWVELFHTTVDELFACDFTIPGIKVKDEIMAVGLGEDFDQYYKTKFKIN